MSIDFVPDRNIPFSEIETFHYEGVTVDRIKDGSVLLTDGTNFMWVYPADETVTSIDSNENYLDFESENPYKGMMFSRYAGNNPIKIIEAVEDHFNVRLICEYEDEYNKFV
ncbi:MAG TPA: hypothetical protein PK178_00685 [Smithellaceae bacterium]|nr:hypothetical protein [Smithellaceae bacterium]